MYHQLLYDEYESGITTRTERYKAMRERSDGLTRDSVLSEISYHFEGT